MRLLTEHSHSHLEQCVPSQYRSQSESPAGANPAGIVSDHHKAPAGRAAPNPRMSHLIQKNTTITFAAEARHQERQ